MEVAIEDSQFDEPLEMIAKFEDKCLKPLRVAKCKDINMKKITEVVDWAKLVDKLSSRMDSTFMKQTDRLFLALIDNPRLTFETLLKYVPLLYETEKLLNKAKICIEQRDQIRKTLLLDFSVTKSNQFLREFLRSDRGEYADITEKIDIKLIILQETLKTLKYQDQKVKIILEFMNSDDFQTKEELTKVLSVVKDEDPILLEKIYETMNTS
jgi:hypothetical protein